MSLNGKKVGEFALKAYKNGEFIDVTDKDLQGKWSVLFFYPADFTFVRPNSRICRTSTLNSRRSALRSTPFRVTRTSFTRPGTNPPSVSARFSTR